MCYFGIYQQLAIKLYMLKQYLFYFIKKKHNFFIKKPDSLKLLQ